jgi:tetratricopeptide (TPR) repeat protein
MTKNIGPIFVTVLVMSIALSFYSAQAYAQTPQQTLNQYIADLQKNPNDNALREKIIKHVQGMKVKPSVPEEARKYINRGLAAAEGTKNENDYKDAIAEFQKAVNIAPWLGVGYRGLAIMQDKASLYSQALQNLKLFLLTNPSTGDVEAANTLRDKIEYRQEKAAKESSPAAIAERERNKEQDLIKRLDGVRYVCQTGDNIDKWELELVIRGTTLVFRARLLWHNPDWEGGGGQVGMWLNRGEIPIVGCKAFRHQDIRNTTTGVMIWTDELFTISKDGNSITHTITHSYNSNPYTETFYRK